MSENHSCLIVISGRAESGRTYFAETEARKRCPHQYYHMSLQTVMQELKLPRTCSQAWICDVSDTSWLRYRNMVLKELHTDNAAFPIYLLICVPFDPKILYHHNYAAMSVKMFDCTAQITCYKYPSQHNPYEPGLHTQCAIRRLHESQDEDRMSYPECVLQPYQYNWNEFCKREDSAAQWLQERHQYINEVLQTLKERLDSDCAIHLLSFMFACIPQRPKTMCEACQYILMNYNIH